MTYEAFSNACETSAVDTVTEELLRSLYYDKTGDWDTAHTIAQSIHTTDGSRVHAYLHREEGDLGNAGYWYSRAGEAMPSGSLDDEWETLARRYTTGE